MTHLPQTPAPKKIPGGPLAPLGFLGGTASCGIKDGKPTRPDLALIAATHLCTAAATFTTNRVKAAPVKISAQHIRSQHAAAVVLNSGNANACTGPDGEAAALATAQHAAHLLGCKTQHVLICSTGRIGVPLPLQQILTGLDSIQLSRSTAKTCAQAIMTSDTFPKLRAYQLSCPTGSYRIGAMAKGAGMINPNMATMLCILTTDAIVAPDTLKKILKSAVANSFNLITVDGDMSTNDTVIALASGDSGTTPAPEHLAASMQLILRDMARLIVLDGEGVSKFIEVQVENAASISDARKAAESVANSKLVKCAWAGNDPNWGRILCALGYSGASLSENKIDIDYNHLPVVRSGRLADSPWKQIKKIAASKQFRVTIRLNQGRHSYTIWTTDLTEKYVKLNLGE